MGASSSRVSVNVILSDLLLTPSPSVLCVSGDGHVIWCIFVLVHISTPCCGSGACLGKGNAIVLVMGGVSPVMHVRVLDVVVGLCLLHQSPLGVNLF